MFEASGPTPAGVAVQPTTVCAPRLSASCSRSSSPVTTAEPLSPAAHQSHCNPPLAQLLCHRFHSDGATSPRLFGPMAVTAEPLQIINSNRSGAGGDVTDNGRLSTNIEAAVRTWLPIIWDCTFTTTAIVPHSRGSGASDASVRLKPYSIPPLFIAISMLHPTAHVIGLWRDAEWVAHLPAAAQDTAPVSAGNSGNHDDGVCLTACNNCRKRVSGTHRRKSASTPDHHRPPRELVAVMIVHWLHHSSSSVFSGCDPDRPFILLSLVATHRKYHGYGIGKALMNALRSVAAALDVQVVLECPNRYYTKQPSLAPGVLFSQASDFYGRACAYKTISEPSTCYGRGSNHTWMCLPRKSQQRGIEVAHQLSEQNVQCAAADATSALPFLASTMVLPDPARSTDVGTALTGRAAASPSAAGSGAGAHPEPAAVDSCFTSRQPSPNAFGHSSGTSLRYSLSCFLDDYAHPDSFFAGIGCPLIGGDGHHTSMRLQPGKRPIDGHVLMARSSSSAAAGCQHPLAISHSNSSARGTAFSVWLWSFRTSASALPVPSSDKRVLYLGSRGFVYEDGSRIR